MIKIDNLIAKLKLVTLFIFVILILYYLTMEQDLIDEYHHILSMIKYYQTQYDELSYQVLLKQNTNDCLELQLQHQMIQQELDIYINELNE